MSNNLTNEKYVNQFAILAEGLAFNKSLDKYRANAISDLSNSQFPTMKTEEWKYTNLKPLLINKYEHSANVTLDKLSKNDIQKFKYNFSNYSIVLINGVFVKELSNIDEIESKLKISTLTEALGNDDKIAKKYFDNIADRKTAFDFLNTANFTDGLFISVSKNTQIEKPIHIINISLSQNSIAFIPNRVLIHIGENSEASIVESYTGIGDSDYFHSINSEIFIDNNAKLNIYKIETEADKSSHISKVDVVQKQDSLFRHFNFTFKGKLIRNDINVELDGENIETTLNGLYLGDGKQHIDNNTFINHAKPHSTSNELYKGILNDNAHAIFSGKILVETDAQLTNAYQNNNTILLSDNATIDTKPQLEIYADDVKCTHGATVGQLDESALFYILSRGIPKETARTMLINAFAESVVTEISIDVLRDEITNLIYKNLHREEKNESK